MEDTAENIIKQLDGLGMLQDFNDGSRVKVCRPYWEFSICKVEEQGFATVCVNSLIHLAVAGGDKDRFTWHLCPISVFHGHKNPLWASLGTVFGGLKFLLVLDLNGEIEYLPNEVGDLIHLRYLGLENSEIRELPASIDNLKKLQTLNIRMCGNLKKLPNEVLNMQQLRHIEMSRSFDDGEIRVPSGIRILVNLHSFCGLYAGDGIARELSSLTQLRILGIKRVCDYHGGELFESIMKMVDLVSSSLEAKTTWFGEEDSRKTVLLSLFEPFLPPPLVCELHLQGGLVEFPKWIASMGNLTRLHSSISYLSESPTPVLQFLPKLKHLNLWHAYNVKYIGKEFCPAGGFQKLETFTLACDSPVEWTENLSKLQKLCLKPLHHDLKRRLNGKDKYKIEHIITLKYYHPFPSPWPEE